MLGDSVDQTDFTVSWEPDPALDDLGEAITELVLRAELGRRLPEASLARATGSVEGIDLIRVGPHGDVRVDDVVALVPRHVAGPVVDQRVAQLRATSVLPDQAHGSVLVYDGRTARPDGISPVGDTSLVELPRAPVQDTVATLSVASALITSDPLLAGLASAFRAEPVAPGDAIAMPPRHGLPPTPAVDLAAIDTRLDELSAVILERRAAVTGMSELDLARQRAARFAAELAAVRRTHQIALSGAALARRRSDEALQDARHEVDAARGELHRTNSELDEIRAQRDLLRTEKGLLRTELDAVYATKTFRATEALRRAYSRVRFGREP